MWIGEQARVLSLSLTTRSLRRCKQTSGRSARIATSLASKPSRSILHSACSQETSIARDEYIIWKLQPEIVKSVKAELGQLDDKKMRQKVCLTPIDKDSKHLREKPRLWDEIKAGKFMIINGQHSITASKELQISRCGEKCRVELSKWEAYII